MSTVAYAPKATLPLKPSATAAPVAAVVPAIAKRTAPPSRPAASDPDTAPALVISVVRRLEGYLDEETAALEKSLDFDFKTSNDRKSQGLFDFNQALRRLQPADVNADLKVRLATFRQKLAANLRTIRLHLDAVKEIASILSEAIQNAESDGTYTRNIGPYRGAF
jgi:hypothetical protein